MPYRRKKLTFAISSSDEFLLTSVEKNSPKFRHVKTSSGKVVATSFFSLTVHRWIAGDVPIYLKFAFEVTNPRRKTPISTISLNSAAAVRAGEKINYR